MNTDALVILLLTSSIILAITILGIVSFSVMSDLCLCNCKLFLKQTLEPV